MNTITQHRHTPGLSPAFNAMLAALGEGVNQLDRSSYPPQNIYRTSQDDYFIEMALAGFTQDDLEITVENNLLTIGTATRENANAESDEKTYLHRGIARRDFQTSFKLGQHIVVQDARMENGLLVVHLKREIPEEARPRRIQISAA